MVSAGVPTQRRLAASLHAINRASDRDATHRVWKGNPTRNERTNVHYFVVVKHHFDVPEMNIILLQDWVALELSLKIAWKYVYRLPIAGRRACGCTRYPHRGDHRGVRHAETERAHRGARARQGLHGHDLANGECTRTAPCVSIERRRKRQKRQSKQRWLFHGAFTRIAAVASILRLRCRTWQTAALARAIWLCD